MSGKTPYIAHAKHWMFTLEAPRPWESAVLSTVYDCKSFGCRYMVTKQDEETLRGYMMFDTQKFYGPVKAMLPERCHIRIARNEPSKHRLVLIHGPLNKNDKVKEYGEFYARDKGTRQDLNGFIKDVKKGLSVADLKTRHGKLFENNSSFVKFHLENRLIAELNEFFDDETGESTKNKIVV